MSMFGAYASDCLCCPHWHAEAIRCNVIWCRLVRAQVCSQLKKAQTKEIKWMLVYTQVNPLRQAQHVCYVMVDRVISVCIGFNIFKKDADCISKKILTKELLRPWVGNKGNRKFWEEFVNILNQICWNLKYWRSSKQNILEKSQSIATYNHYIIPKFLFSPFTITEIINFPLNF